MLFFNKTKKYLKSLITSNNGESSKSFFLVSITIIGIFLLFITGFALIVDVICNGYIMTDLYGVSSFVVSIASLLGVTGWTKVSGEKNCNIRNYTDYYKPQDNYEKETYDDIYVKPCKNDIDKALK